MVAYWLLGATSALGARSWALSRSDRHAPSPPPPRRFAGLGRLLAAAGGAALAWRSPNALMVPTLGAFAGVATALSEVDLAEMRISRHVVLLASGAAAVSLVVVSTVSGHWGPGLGALASAGGVFALFFALHLLAPRGFGFGDVRMGGLCGLICGSLGWRVALNGLLGAALLAGFAAAVVVISGAPSRSTKIPFAPFLAAGSIVAIALA